jgi:hypothetical protein
VPSHFSLPVAVVTEDAKTKENKRRPIAEGVPDRTTRGPTTTFATRSRVAKVVVGAWVVRSGIFNLYHSFSTLDSLKVEMRVLVVMVLRFITAIYMLLCMNIQPYYIS